MASKTSRQDTANEDNWEVPSLLPYLEWNETGTILDVDNRLVNKLDFSRESFKQKFSPISKFFRHPTWEDIKELVDEQQKLTDFLVFIEDSNPAFYGVATIEKRDGCYRASIAINSEDPHKDLVENSPIGACVSTDNGKFLIVNRKLADIYGYESVENMLAEEDIANVYYEAKDRERLVKMVEDVKQEGEEGEINFQFIGRRKNGELVIISKDVHPRFHGDKIVFLYGYITDISEDSDDAKNPSPVFKCDLDCKRIIYVNKAMSSHLGYNQCDLRKMNFAELCSDPRQLDCLKEDLRKIRNLHDIEVVLKRKDGSTVEALMTVSIVTAENGQTKDDVYVRGSLQCQLSDPVKTILMDELRTALAMQDHSLSTEVQEWLVSAAREISEEMVIDHLSSNELSQLVQNIQEVCEHDKDQDSSKLKFLPDLKFSLKEKIRSTVINSLRFFNYRSQLLENACTMSDLLTILKFSEKDVITRIQDKLLLAIDKDGELLFPRWQFDIDAPDRVIDQLPQVLQALDETPITQLNWLMLPHDAFGGKKPYEVLKTGTKEDKQKLVSEASAVGGW